MICSHIQNRKRYTLCVSFEKAFAFLENLTDATPDGTYELDGKNVFAMVQSYDTVPGEPVQFEVHRKYIDIQYTISGVEVLAWTPDTGKMTVKSPYDAEKDFAFLAAPEQAQTEIAHLEMKPGMFAVFFPEDAHWGKVQSAAAGPQHVRKVCIKIAVDTL